MPLPLWNHIVTGGNVAKVQRKQADALEVLPGTKALLEPVRSGKRIKTVFVGLDKGNYVALKLPLNRQIIDSLGKDARVTVRFMQEGGVICGFDTQVAGAVVRPFPILFLAYPQTLEVLTLRESPRVSCFLPVTVFHDAEDHAGAVVNISSGGCRIVLGGSGDEAAPMAETGDEAGKAPADKGAATVPDIPKDAEIFCQIRLFDAQEDSYVKGVVRNVARKGDALSLGVQFDELSEEIQESIQGYVRTVIRHLS
jgi:c-di-GMP-binding flagellar brake protein YcgR